LSNQAEGLSTQEGLEKKEGSEIKDELKSNWKQ
jgi:hypothetical protein